MKIETNNWNCCATGIRGAERKANRASWMSFASITVMSASTPSNSWAPLLRNSGQSIRPRSGAKYEAVSGVITQVWEAAEQLCGKRLVQALPLWLPHYERHFGRLLPKQKKLLHQVSAATLDRLL